MTTPTPSLLLHKFITPTNTHPVSANLSQRPTRASTSLLPPHNNSPTMSETEQRTTTTTTSTTLPLRTNRDQQAPEPSSTQQDRKVVDGPSVATTTTWTPNLARRQSWNAQDRTHELQMATVHAARTGPGFTERSS